MEKRKPAQSFRDLVVWQKAHRLVLGVYKMTKSFPREELYGSTISDKKVICFCSGQHSGRL